MNDPYNELQKLQKSVHRSRLDYTHIPYEKRRLVNGSRIYITVKTPIEWAHSMVKSQMKIHNLRQDK